MGRCCSSRLELKVFALPNDGRNGAGFFLSGCSTGGQESGRSSEVGGDSIHMLVSLGVHSGVGDCRAMWK
jgi:hypothetical protein